MTSYGRLKRPLERATLNREELHARSDFVRRATAFAAPCVEALEVRRLMAGDPATLQTLPYALDFETPRGGIVDRDGEGTGFTWVQPTRTNDEYHPDLLNLRPADGVLDLTTFGSSSIGSHWEGDNTLADALQVQFNGSSSVFTISAHLVGPLGFIDRPNEQAGVLFGPDQDNFIKFVALGQANGSVLQFTDESAKAGGGFTHTLSSTASLTSVGDFNAITSLDLMISADAGTGKVSAYYSINDGPVAKVTKEITLSGVRKTTFFASVARAGIMAAHKNDLGPITVSFDDFAVMPGAPVITRPSVTATRPSDGETNVSRDGFVAADVFLPNPGEGIDAATLTPDSVKLLRSSDGAPVDAHVNTSGGGDSIVLQPSGPLDPNTKFTFVVTDAVKDTGGNSFVPFTSGFTTGTAVNATNPSIAFEKVELASAQGAVFTGVTVGPDGRLYAGTDTGLIERFNIAGDGTLGAPQIITTVLDGNAGAQRLLTGIRFDPSSTADNLILWVTHGESGVEGAADWTGKISRLSGPNLEHYQDYVTGLPRSIRDHLTNQIDFGPDGALYISQGSTTAMGAPDNVWGLRTEHLLSAAILRLDLPLMAQRFAHGLGALDSKTEGAGAYDPFAAGAPLTLYATGVRNAYDLIWASNGRLYAPTNGSASGGNTPGYPNSVFASQRIDQAANGPYSGTVVPALANVKNTEDDFLFDVQKGGYYGHPNPSRGEYVLDGGNPTAGVDFEEFSQYPVGTQPDRNYQHPAFVFGKSYSPDGIIEYHGNAFGGALDHSLLVTRYSGGDDIVVLHPAADGSIDSMQSGIAGLTHFVDPLDLTEDNRTGFIYVAEYGGQKITLLRPIAPGARLSTDRARMFFNDPLGGVASPAELLTITNTGSTPLAVPSDGLSITGPDANAFTIASAPSLPATVPPGQSITLGISFAPAAGSSLAIRGATLQIKSNGAGSSLTLIPLRGLPTTGTGGPNEPSLQHLLDLYQIPVNVGDANPDNTNLFSNEEPLEPSDEVPMQRLYKASPGPVTIEPLAVFGVTATPALRFGWYSGGSSSDKTQLFTVPSSDAQSVNPTIAGATEFDPGEKSFGFYSAWPGFGDREVFSEDALNTQELTPANQHKVRFYPLKNSDGTVVPNAYVMAHEEFVNDPTGAYDNQDIVAIIRNVRPAGGAEIGIESADGLTIPNRLVFNRIEHAPPDPKTDPITGLVTQPPDNVVHDRSILRIRNTGSAPLTISSMVLSSTAWVIDDPPTGPTTIPAGGSINVTVRFVAHNIPPGQTENQTVGAAANAGGLWTGTLTINSDDSDEPTTTVDLAGWWQSHSEFNQEPTLPIIVNRIFGFGTDILSPGETLNSGGKVQSAGEEVLSPYWVRANATAAVTVRQLDAFHTQGNTETIRTFLKGSTQSAPLITHDGAEGQSLLPHDLSGSPAIGTLTSAQAAGAFGFRVQAAWSDDTRNTQQQSGGDFGHNLRFYPARDAGGNLIPNTWILAQDYYSTDPITGAINSNFDYQDNLYLVTNIRPATPATPTNVIAVPNGNGIRLDWSDSPERTVTGYNVYRSKTAGGTYTMLNATPITVSEFFDGSAPTGATSYYRVTAADDWGGESGRSVVVSAPRATDVTAPAPPSSLTATGETGGIRLAWVPSADTDVIGYLIYRASSAAAAYMLLNPGGPAAAASYLDASSATQQQWFYRIAAVDGSGNVSLQSDAASAVRPPDTDQTAPAAPTNLVAAGQGNGISLTWSASPEIDVAGYRLYRAAESAGAYSLISGSDLLTATAFLDTKVDAGVTWFYRVSAVDVSGNESTSSTPDGAARIAVGGGGGGNGLRGDYYNTPDFTGAPFSRADTAVNFYWDTGSPDPAIDPETFSVRWTGQLLAPTTETYTFTARTDDGVRVWINNQLIIDRFESGGGMIDASGSISLEAGRRYDLRVDYFENTGRAGAKLFWQTATIANEIVPTSNLFTSPVVDNTPPPVVGHLSAVPGSGKVEVSWASVVDPDLAGYNLYRDTTGKKNFIKLNNLPITGTSFIDTTAPVGVMRYNIVAVDEAGNESAPLGITILKPGDGIVGGGLRGDYFDNADFTNQKLTRVDRSINFYWDNGSPATTIAPDTFSVRWTGQIQAISTEAYEFTTREDDGVRLWIDGKLVIDRWTNTDGITESVSPTISLVAGQRYDIRLEYFEGIGRAGVKLYWETPTIGKEIVPSLNLFAP